MYISDNKVNMQVYYIIFTHQISENKQELGLSSGQTLQIYLQQIRQIKSMSNRQTFSKTFYKSDKATIPSQYIYDEVYKNASSKNKYSNDPQYSYYNALLDIRHKMSEKHNPIYDDIFSYKQKPQESEQVILQKKTIMPIYHVQKINKMKFKVYKQGAGKNFIDKLPVTDLCFQIKLKGDNKNETNSRPRLQQIINQYRKMNISNLRENRLHEGRSYGVCSSDFNIRLMNKTMNKINRSKSNTHRR